MSRNANTSSSGISLPFLRGDANGESYRQELPDRTPGDGVTLASSVASPEPASSTTDGGVVTSTIIVPRDTEVVAVEVEVTVSALRSCLDHPETCNEQGQRPASFV